MSKESNVIEFNSPVRAGFDDALTEVLRTGAKELLKVAVEAEVMTLLESYSHMKTSDGKRAIVKNGYLPERTVQTGIGDVSVRVRVNGNIKFNSSIIPPYLKRSRSLEELLPCLYLRGISTGDFQEGLMLKAYHRM